jgi:uncharacterized protein YrrD
MKFINNVDVLSNQGEKVGTLERVVIDPKTRDVTHLVVSQGLLSDIQKIVPVGMVGVDDEGQVLFQEDEEAFKGLPKFEQADYVSASAEQDPDLEASLYWYPPALAWAQTGSFTELPTPNYAHKAERNIPEGAVPLEEGAEVISRDEQTVGNVESIHTAPDDTATHLVISGGLVLKKKKLIPTHWINDIHEEQIRLAVAAEVIDRLPEYQPSTSS